MSRLSQENRFLTITDFSLGEDTFIATSFNGSEYVSGLFEFQIDLLSENLDVNPSDIVGKSGTVSFNNENGRKFNGYIKTFSAGGMLSHDIRQYRMTMVPWLWFLSQTNNHRIFQDLNTKDIVTEVFKDRGFNDFDFRAEGGKVREYCVQHNESDLNFVSRLLEEEGIAYYFEHSDSKHKLILVDQKNAYEDCAETDLEYDSGSRSITSISAWERIHRFKKGMWSLADYNFKDPTKKIDPQASSSSDFANNSKFEHYEYPGLYDEPFSMGKDIVKIRLDAEEADRDVVQGRSDCSSFYAGGKFKLKEHPNASEKGSYILVGMTHSAVDTYHFNNSERNIDYSNEFICIPDSVHFRPHPIHKKPYVPGPQSALVTGPDGEEIYVDEYGRVKVQFYWDREGKKDENTTCYIRVMQAWAGAQWGASFIPRIGHEVIVTFLDGDPDRPIITGTVYNGKNRPPFDSKTKSGFRTRSTKKGTSANCNELIFDDKKGDEQIFIHAEKDMDTEVENDETLTVDHDRIKHIKNDETYTIDHDRKKSIGNDQSEDIGRDKSTDVGRDHSETIGGNMTITVDKNLTEKIKVDYTENVEGNKNSTITKDLSEKIKANHNEEVTKNYSLKAKKIQLTAQDEISIKVGSASILMKKNGDITIKGKKINVKGSSDIIMKGSNIKEN